MKETVTINGKSSVVEKMDPYNIAYVSGTHDAHASNIIQSPEYYRQLANDYLKNTLLPAFVFDEKVHNQGATVYFKHSVINGKAFTKLDLYNPKFSDGFHSSGKYVLRQIYAIDGQRHPDDKHFAHSSTDRSVFTVDLFQRSHITEVVIFPRLLCCYDRYINMKVRVGGQYGYPVAVFNTNYVKNNRYKGLRWVFSPDQTIGNKIVVENGHDHAIQINEIEVSGVPIQNSLERLELTNPRFSNGHYAAGKHILRDSYATDSNMYPDDSHFAQSKGLNETFYVDLVNQGAKLHEVYIWPRQGNNFDRYYNMTVECEGAYPKGQPEARLTSQYVRDHEIQGLKWTFPNAPGCNRIVVRNRSNVIQIAEIIAYGRHTPPADKSFYGTEPIFGLLLILSRNQNRSFSPKLPKTFTISNKSPDRKKSPRDRRDPKGTRSQFTISNKSRDRKKSPRDQRDTKEGNDGRIN